MTEKPTREDIVVVHRASTSTEAVVIRGLLESVGIASPAPTSHTPYPMREPPRGFCDGDVVVLASQADEARKIIADYVAQGASESAE